jgi:hypothetical protein
VIPRIVKRSYVVDGRYIIQEKETILLLTKEKGKGKKSNGSRIGNDD